MVDEATRKFVLEHEADDTSRLLFAAASYPDVDMKTAARLIEARRKASVKLPSWYACEGIDYPSSLSLEQCSSEETALYKQRFVKPGDVVADITGGLGVDSFFLSRKAARVFYYERQELLCKAAADNFRLLGAGNIEVNCAEEPTWSRKFDLIYADPARRGKSSSRVYDIPDCEPDIHELKPRLMEIADRLLVKVSPMADISRMLELFPDCAQIHVVASSGEVKELLLYIVRDFDRGKQDVRIVAGDLSFAPEEERSAVAVYCSSVGKYLYVPSKAVLKAGAFKLVSSRWKVEKLSHSTHLYTSDELLDDFPGKRWKVQEVLPWNNRTASDIRRRFSSAELTASNFPLDTAALRRKLKMADGPQIHIFATTVGSTKVLITAEQ